jgi:hypothetical protein
MHYSSHAIGPLLALTGKDVEMVCCLGSGRIDEKLALKYGSPYAVESALFRLKDSNIAAEVTRSLFQTSREYIESFDVYAEKTSFEWRKISVEDHVLFRGDEGNRICIPDFAHLLPEGIQSFTSGCLSDSEEHRKFDFKKRSNHGGSRPHMVHEFISSIVGKRRPYPNVDTAANWTFAGLCAHESALKGGKLIILADEVRRHYQCEV